MTERPILFSSPMIKAILEGRKTQTRRLINPQPDHLQRHEWRGELIYEGEHRLWCWKRHTFENLWDEHVRDADRMELSCMSSYGVVGDRLWVRETWRSWTQNNCHQHEDDPDEDAGCGEHCNQTYVAYRATPRVGYRPVPDKQRICYLDDSSPLERNKELLGPWRPSIFMPRMFSRITLEITDVRVQRLHEISEADARAEGCRGVHGAVGQTIPGPPLTARDDFAGLWDRINGKRVPWESSPWVWAISFRRLP